MNQAQQEQLLSIGSYLQSVRQEKGKSIDEAANQIFIRPALVKAIEQGDWESLPEPIFVQGFIRRYAEYLGLDGLEISKKFEPTPVAVLPNPQLANHAAVEGVVEPQDKHGLQVLSKAEPSYNGAVPKRSTSSGMGPWLIGLLGLIPLIGLVVWLATRNAPQQASGGNSTEQAAPPAATTDNSEAAIADTAPPAPATAAPETTPAPTPTAAATPTPTPTTPADSDSPITFGVNLAGDSWMRVTVDGREVYEGILTSGTKQSWTAQNELRVTAGNSGAVLYTFNGSEEAPLGAAGTVSNLTLTPETNPQALPTP